MVKLHKTGRFIGSNGVGGNSVSVVDGDFVTKTGGFILKTIAGANIEGVTAGEQSVTSDNQTVAKEKIQYIEKDDYSEYKLDVAGETITFTGALVTSNVINLKVNGVAMTPVTFSSSDATTLGLIATQLVTDFPTLIASASAGTNSVKITPVEANSTVTITDIVVTLGAGQVTGSVALNTLAQTDEGKFYDITTVGQSLDYHTAHATSGQVKFVKFIEGTTAIVNVANT